MATRRSTTHHWLASYDAGVPAEVAVPDGTLDGLLRDAAAVTPAATALDFLGATTTFAALDDAVDRFARAAVMLGVTPGARVSLHLPTCPSFVIALLGAMRAGAIAVPMNPLYTAHELTGMMRRVRPALSVALDLLHPRVRAARAGLGAPLDGIPVVCVGIQHELRPPLRWLYPLKARREGRWNPVPDTPASPTLPRLLGRTPAGSVPSAAGAEDAALLQPTGGTTGTPKFATLTHRNLLANAAQVRAWLNADTRPGDAMLAALPYFHIYGLTVAMSFSLLARLDQVLLPRFDPRQLMRTIARTRPRFFPGAPIMYAAVADHPRAGRHDLTSIEYCISGSAPLDPSLQRRFEALTGGRMIEGYGLSEAGPVTHANPLEGENRVGSIGLPFPSTDARVMDVATGTRELLDGEPGQLWVRGPQVMRGYWEAPDETEAVLRNGWLATGDVATRDADGYFHIVDRLKDVILVGGLNVYPREVEEVLCAHPAVAQAAVVARRDARHGEVPAAYCVLAAGASAAPDQLIAHCAGSLARYKVPRTLELRDELPVTFIGKVLRRALVEEEERAAAVNEGS